MDQYDSQHPSGGRQPAQDSTPIYDRLFAEWCAAGRGIGPGAPSHPAPRPSGGFVPAARASGEAGRA
ncbi:hypothetical protein Sfulv_49290 [Streptomyces fulvorobeus]|uniref:Uncharacterized protein n=1 Tax=Streptomyces fulvorobeus TaxID=284028 RepID=A0A7J0CCJ5_9ACTN|nr:hypothetical protein [Streptomyces fulvorobeus]NYE43639.1 hypothetical protein [Streptomyces fulvorobeus]GFN00119.1 hypothetical protein Sfulv_49290 [Streptomyces fulvorobeus]